MRNVLLGLVGLVTFAGLTGCSSADPSTPGTEGSGSGNGTPEPVKPPAFGTDQGQQANSAEGYAPGPYGISLHSTIANYQFVGYPSGQSTNGLHIIQLADFYNPTGTGTFPAGSALGDGAAKPKVLLIDVASVWCGPCNDEAKTTLPGKYDLYKPRGGEFLLNLADGPTPGISALPKNLTNWTKSYNVKFPAMIDPAYKLGSLFVDDAFPTNIIVDTTTMEIVDILAGDTNPLAGGQPAKDFWAKYETYLNP